MSISKASRDPNYLFTLRVPVYPPCLGGRRIFGPKLVVIEAFEGPYSFTSPHHTRINVKVRLGGKVVFPLGVLYCGLPGQYSLDGLEARELVLSLVAMRPGDTDASYFEGYSEAQLAFAETCADDLTAAREWRYCDENGNVRQPRRKR